MKNPEAKISVMEERMNNLIKQNASEHENIINKLIELDHSIKYWAESADKKYAAKFIEKVIWGGSGALALWFLNQIFRIVEIH